MPVFRPCVSILVPVFNNEHYLEECLSSIMAQTLKSVEIILINDGSTSPESVKIMRDFCDKSRKVHFIDKENTGYGHSLNVGIEMAKGEYIGIVESDDFIHPKMYETLYAIAKNERLDAIKSDFAYFIDYRKRRLFAKGHIHKEKADYNRVITLQGKTEVFKSISLNQPGIYKRGFLQSNKIKFNESPGASYQDNGFFFQIFLNAEHMYFYDHPLYFLRRDNESSSVNNRGQWQAIFEEYAFIERLILSDGKKQKKYCAPFLWKKFNSYFFNLRRIAPEYKERFLSRFAEEFRKHEKSGYFDLSLFNELELSDLMAIMADPEVFLKNNGDRLKPKNYLVKEKARVDMGADKSPCTEEVMREVYKIPVKREPRLSFFGKINSLVSRINL